MNLVRQWRYWSRVLFFPGRLLRDKYRSFRELLQHDRKCLELLSDLEAIHYSGTPVDWSRVTRLVVALRWSVSNLVRSLDAMHPDRYLPLIDRFQQLEQQLQQAVSLPAEDTAPPYVITLAEAASAAPLAGGKAHQLGVLLNRTDLVQPQAFVITATAGRLLLAANRLREPIDELLGEVDMSDTPRLHSISREIVDLITGAEVPPPVLDAVGNRLDQFRRPGHTTSWAVRSSAVGEDGVFSFAGQYQSLLSVADADLLDAYKTVLAGKYRPEAIAYRIRCGLADQETPMAALIMEMVQARAGGVIYSRDPDQRTVPDRPAPIAVYAVAGLGASLVDGSADPEIHHFMRQPDGTLEALETTATRRKADSRPPLLDPATARRLAGWGQLLENLLGSPQDIEWCQDETGRCLLLQCRPLLDRQEKTGAPGTDTPPVPARPLLTGGLSAAPGVGIGTVYLAETEAHLQETPPGSILVLTHLPPTLAAIIDRLQAVVCEGGSRASHFATIAREFGLPVITGLQGATTVLRHGAMVTVDGWSATVYPGRLDTLAERYPQRTTILATPFAERMGAVVDLVSPLHLVDPTASNFKPQHCRSMHDVIRYSHEKGMTEMFSLVGRSGRELSGAKRVDGELPFTLSIIDLGGGLTAESARRRTVTPKQFASPLLRACWQGLSHPDVTWHDGLLYLDWQEADRLAGGIVNLKSAKLGSYAVVARDYLHLMLRFGYHFAIIDSLAGDEPEANYLTFRFKGGGGSYDNRLRRLRLVSEVLNWAGFSTHAHGDLLDARFDRRSAAETINRLVAVSIIQGKCQLLDMKMDSDDSIAALVESMKKPLSAVIDGSP